MWNTSREDQDLVRELARDVVAAIAPAESDTFDQLFDTYMANPDPHPTSGEIDDSTLGSGLIEPTLVTTIVTAAVSVGFYTILQIIRDAIQAEIGETLKEILRNLFRRKATGNQASLQTRSGPSGESEIVIITVVAPTGPAQVTIQAERLTEQIATELVRRKVGRRQARSVAKAVVARFAGNEPV